MSDLIQKRQVRLSSLRQFVDTLEDIHTDDSDEINESIQKAFHLLHQTHYFERYERHKMPHIGHESIIEILNHIHLCTERSASDKTVESHHKAPDNLLSLRDYSVLQATIELAICWGTHRLLNHCIRIQKFESGDKDQIEVNILTPIRNRRPTKTFQIRKNILEWRNTNEIENPLGELLMVSRSLIQLLLLPEFRPILLAKYLIDLFAMVIYGEACLAINEEDREAFKILYATLIAELPLQLSMSSIRAMLGQCQLIGFSSFIKLSESDLIEMNRLQLFKKACGKCLSTLMLEPGGVKATLDMLLGSVQEGDTQARMQVANLITKCPSSIPASQYFQHLYREIKDILRANDSHNVIKETSVLAIIHHIMDSQAFSQQLFETQFLDDIFAALLLLERRECPENVNADSILANELQVEQCTRILDLFLCGVPVRSKVLTALVRVFYPALLLYCFTKQSKSYLLGQIRPILINWISRVQDPITLIKTALKKESSMKRKEHTAEFRAGESGGVVVRACRVEVCNGNPTTLPNAIVSLLSDNWDGSNVAGKLLTYLLTEHMQMKRSTNVHKYTAGYKRTVLSLMIAMMEKLGASVLQDIDVIFEWLRTILTAYQTQSNSQKLVDTIEPKQSDDIALDDLDQGDDDEMITLGLGILTTIIEVGAPNRSESEEAQLCQFLTILRDLSVHKRPEIAGLAADARANILSRELEVTSQSSASFYEKKDFASTLKNAKLDLESTLVPLRARGIVSLTKLVRSCVVRKKTKEWMEIWENRIQQLLTIYIDHLSDEESYVYLASIQGLSTLADAHPKFAIPLLMHSLRDETLTLEKRIKLSEAILFSARRCGESLPVYSKPLLYAFLECARPKQDSRCLNFSDYVRRATFRASCLSNVAEICVLLGWSLEPFVVDVLTCAFGILQIETVENEASNSLPDSGQLGDSDMVSPTITIRRAAVFLLKYLIQMLGWKLLDLIPDQLHALYHTLGVVKSTDRDQVVIYHANCALIALGDVLKEELFPQAHSFLPDGLALLGVDARPASALKLL
uniref:Uncharacterized protein AlNc14C309G10484 n=1 Tax=Albugo laibachii Nc14 TaxID=890382 RepID=F0WW36_9STRA|nr:conserved hypothetical protein [Albugo laibachii Nc14]|eukprot:CCA25643.1 conserved hypothetical protein [Albugo laibachii Nc14]